jgi:hypothetical protein
MGWNVYSGITATGWRRRFVMMCLKTSKSIPCKIIMMVVIICVVNGFRAFVWLGEILGFHEISKG